MPALAMHRRAAGHRRGGLRIAEGALHDRDDGQSEDQQTGQGSNRPLEQLRHRTHPFSPARQMVSKTIDYSSALPSLDRLTKVLVLVPRVENGHNMAFTAFGHLATQNIHGLGGLIEKRR